MHTPALPPHPPPQFNEMKEANDGQSALLTPEQHHWLSVQKLLSVTSIEVSPPPRNLLSLTQ